MSNANFLYLGDKNYFKYAVTSIYSLLENNQHLSEISVYYIDDNLSDKEKKHLEYIINKFRRKIIWISAEPIIKFLEDSKIPKYKNSYAVYYRWFVYDYLNVGDRLIYLDSDTIIRGKVDEIINFNMNGKPLAMSLDGMYKFYIKYLKLEDKKYFNTGVVVFDVDKCVNAKIKERFSDFLLNNNIKLLYSEQDVASIVFNDFTTVLEAYMNVFANYMAFSTNNFYKALSINCCSFYSKSEIEYAKQNPLIEHCSAFFGSRPWHKDTIHPYLTDFNEYFAKAGYDDKDKIDYKLPFIKKFVYNLPEPVKIFFYAMFTRMNVKNLLRKSREDKC